MPQKLDPPSITQGRAISGLPALADLALDYAKLSKSANTRRAYQCDWADFSFWCTQHGLCPLPAEYSTISLYLADRASNSWLAANHKLCPPLKAATLQRRLITIYQAHRLANFLLERSHPAITETWRGIRNTIGTAQAQAKPITLDLLQKMLLSINTDSPAHVRDRALLLLGFAAALRRSELANLKVSDLVLVREGYILTLSRSKVDQFAQGREIGIPYGSNPLTCPVRAIQDWIALSLISTGPLFRSIDRHGNIGVTPLSDRSITLIIKRTIGTFSSDTLYSGHSLRAGFATSAAQALVPEHAIMRQTGHRKSDTLKKYIRIGTLWDGNAATKIGL